MKSNTHASATTDLKFRDELEEESEGSYLPSTEGSVRIVNMRRPRIMNADFMRSPNDFTISALQYWKDTLRASEYLNLILSLGMRFPRGGKETK